MAPKSVAAPAKSKGFNFLPWWVWVWFVVSQLVVLWDGAFVFLRPDSFPGGKYAHFFGPCTYLSLLQTKIGSWSLNSSYETPLATSSPLSFLAMLVIFLDAG